MVFVTGSTFIVADVLSILDKEDLYICILIRAISSVGSELPYKQGSWFESVSHN